MQWASQATVQRNPQGMVVAEALGGSGPSQGLCIPLELPGGADAGRGPHCNRTRKLRNRPAPRPDCVTVGSFQSPLVSSQVGATASHAFGMGVK